MRKVPYTNPLIFPTRHNLSAIESYTEYAASVTTRKISDNFSGFSLPNLDAQIITSTHDKLIPEGNSPNQITMHTSSSVEWTPHTVCSLPDSVSTRLAYRGISGTRDVVKEGCYNRRSVIEVGRCGPALQSCDIKEAKVFIGGAGDD